MGLRRVTLRTLTICWVAIVPLAGAQPRISAQIGYQPNPAAVLRGDSFDLSCPGGEPLGAVDLSVQTSGQPLPFRSINHLSEGDILRYAPILMGKEKRSGQVALVLVPEKREPGEPTIIVMDSKPADNPQHWKMPQTISLVALVYGPAGLSRKGVAKFLTQDESLVAQLADYADKTGQAEQLVVTLSNAESSAESINAALNSFASHYGLPVQLDRNAPVASQAQALFAKMNAQLASYNPLSARSTAQRAGQTASMATAAATLFFGSPVGLAAGGTTMLLRLHHVAFPDTQFRASFAQARGHSAVQLCGQPGLSPPHTRVAYIWATRIPNISPPLVRIQHNASFVALTQKNVIPVEVAELGWKYLDRARNWALVDTKENKTAIPVVKLGNQKALELDLTGVSLPPGEYKLSALWDTTPLVVKGTIHGMPLSDFKSAHLEPASQDNLIARSGKLAVTIINSDFEFVTNVAFRKVNDPFESARDLRFRLPQEKGPRRHMDVQIDTQDLDPGDYELLISQQDGKSHPVPLKVLSNPPRFGNLPIVVNVGAGQQRYILTGERLDLVTRIEAPRTFIDLSPAAADGLQRVVTVELKDPKPKPGTTLAVDVYVRGRSRRLVLPDALEVTGPRPIVIGSQYSPPTRVGIGLEPGEHPAGYTLNAILTVNNLRLDSIVRMRCAGATREVTSLQIGEQNARQSVQRLSSDQLFIAFETGDLPAGCSLQFIIDNGRDGSSSAFTLVQIVRFPRIDSFTVAPREEQNGAVVYQLSGMNLELIEKLGWDSAPGTVVGVLPAPLPGYGLGQHMEVHIPDPPNPNSNLRVWLRGDKQGRASSIKAPVVSPPSASEAVSSDVEPTPNTDSPPTS